MKRKIKSIETSQAAILKRTPSKLFAAALARSGAGVHADQHGRYGRRERSKLRAEEREARLSPAE